MAFDGLRIEFLFDMRRWCFFDIFAYLFTDFDDLPHSFRIRRSKDMLSGAAIIALAQCNSITGHGIHC